MNRKLVIVSNHAYPFHVGGSETIIKTLSRKMCDKGWSTSVMSSDANRMVKVGDVEVEPGSVDRVLGRARKLGSDDRILIYSDASVCMPAILDAMDGIKAKLAICTVGCNAAISNPRILEGFKKHKDRIEFITHSGDYDDAKLLKSCNIPFRVIPNAVDASEFFVPKSRFRERMKISGSSPMMLMVANCFPGKGHEEIIGMLEKTSYTFPENSVFVFAFATPSWPIAKRMTNAISERLARIRRPRCIILKDASRDVVCEAFASADVTALSSLKEVAPVVILESMASGVPWISFPVGNVPELAGGVIVDCKVKDNQGYLRPNQFDMDAFSRELRELLANDVKRNDLGSAGLAMISQNFNWDAVAKMYHAALQ
jgi:glycosyltransferase involved in cell wall biosynthesis